MALNNQQFLQGIRLQSIWPDMRLTENFFKSVYCREMDAPGFADQAIVALEAAGYSHAREYYDFWVREYEAQYDAMMKRVSVWYRAELEKRWAATEGRKVKKLRKIELMRRKKQLLMQKLQR